MQKLNSNIIQLAFLLLLNKFLFIIGQPYRKFDLKVRYLFNLNLSFDFLFKCLLGVQQKMQKIQSCKYGT